jgi:multiple sugar transport system ATP-binding protein
VGVRPEDVVLQPVNGGGSLRGTVTVSEPLGNEVLIHWDTPVGPMVSRLPGQHRPDDAENAALYFAFEKVHLFHPETEAALNGVV